MFSFLRRFSLYTPAPSHSTKTGIVLDKLEIVNWGVNVSAKGCLPLCASSAINWYPDYPTLHHLPAVISHSLPRTWRKWMDELILKNRGNQTFWIKYVNWTVLCEYKIQTTQIQFNMLQNLFFACKLMWIVSASYFSGHVSVDVSTVLPKKRLTR